MKTSARLVRCLQLVVSSLEPDGDRGAYCSQTTLMQYVGVEEMILHACACACEDPNIVHTCLYASGLPFIIVEVCCAWGPPLALYVACN